MTKLSKQKIAVGSVVIVLIAGLAAVNIIQSQSGSLWNTGPVIDVEARAVEKADISSEVVASGVAELAVQEEVYLEAGIKVREVLVDAFDRVQEGQQIMVLDLDDLYIQLEKERISMQIQQYTYEQSAGLEDGQSIGDLESARMLAENTVKSSQLGLDEAKANFERIQTLYSAGGVSRVELEAAQKKLDDAQITYENAVIRLANAINSENAGTGIQSANVAASQLRVEELERKISKAEASQYATSAGIVTAVNAKDGEMAAGTGPSVIISDFNSLQIRANVNEADKNLVKIGQDVSITSDAIDKSSAINGTVKKIALLAKTLETTTGKEKIFETEINIQDAMKYLNVLSPGQNVDCSINTGMSSDALVCSYDMIIEGKDEEKYVFVIDEKQQTVAKRVVKLGMIADLEAEVLDGLSEGDVVVVNPPLNLKDGSRIKITVPGEASE